MNERIRIRFTRNGTALPVSRLDRSAGLEFGFESSARPKGFSIGLYPGNTVVEKAWAKVRQIEDWRAGEFPLTVTRDGDALVVSGGGKHNPAGSLPAGAYTLHLRVSETRLRDGVCQIEIPPGGEVPVQLDQVGPPVRLTALDHAQWDDELRSVCEHADSRIDRMDPLSWLIQPLPRVERKACLLNLLAKARSLPTARRGESLCPLIESIRWVEVDRIDVKARPGLLAALRKLAQWRDALPIHPSHAENMSTIFGGQPSDYAVESFREPVSQRSMQVVVATHKGTGAQFAEFDIDLGNPNVDLAGGIVHVGELIDPGPTNHLDLYHELRGGATSDFMYYRLDPAV
jgi:hypothetical protein